MDENLSYLTDYIGADVRAEPVCRDVWLPDPPTSRFRYGEPLPRVGSHTGYSDDPALWEVVARRRRTLPVSGQTTRHARPPGDATARAHRASRHLREELPRKWVGPEVGRPDGGAPLSTREDPT